MDAATLTWLSLCCAICASRIVLSAPTEGQSLKKVLFPAEILPIVTVFANMVHFFLGLPILAAFLLYLAGDLCALIWFRVAARQLAIILRNHPPDEEPLPIPPAPQPPSEDQVEVIRPSRTGG